MRKLSLPDRAFGQLLKYINDDDITDINWSRNLWVNHLKKGRYKIENFVLDDAFIQQFYTRISNLMNVQFNKNNPLMINISYTLYEKRELEYDNYFF